MGNFSPACHLETSLVAWIQASLHWFVRSHGMVNHRPTLPKPKLRRPSHHYLNSHFLRYFDDDCSQTPFGFIHYTNCADDSFSNLKQHYSAALVLGALLSSPT